MENIEDVLHQINGIRCKLKQGYISSNWLKVMTRGALSYFRSYYYKKLGKSMQLLEQLNIQSHYKEVKKLIK